MIRRRKFTAITAVLAAGALALTGCSSNGSEGGDGEIVFVDSIPTSPPHLNVQLSTDSATRQVMTSVFDSLVKIDSDYELHPSLATEWEANEDATQFTLHLRDDVVWHDGEPFTAADVKFNMEEVFALHPLGVTLSNVQESVETPDDTTVVVNLNQSFAPYIEALAGQRMLPKHLYEGTDITTNEYNMKPVGTGPYKFDEFSEGERIVMVRNDDYWGDATNIDRVIFQVMPDANARVLALQSNELDRVPGGQIPGNQVETLRENPDYYFSRGGSAAGTQTLFFNTRGEGPLSNPEVRKALYTAIDRQAIVDNVYYGMGAPSRGPIPASIAWATDGAIDFNEEFAFDPEKAGEMLDAAGYPADADGHRFDLNIRVASAFPAFVGTTEVVKSSLEAIGVNVQIIAEDLNVFVDQVYTQHDFDMAVMSFGTFEDPSLGVARLYMCNPDDTNFQNPTGICDEQVDAAFEEASSVADREGRAEAFHEMEERVAELMYTVPLVDDQTESLTTTDGWEGVEEFNSVMYWDWSQLRAAE